MNPFAEIFKHLAISLIFTLIGFIFGNMFVPLSFVYMARNIMSILMIVLLVLALFSKKGLIPRRFSMNYIYLFTFIEGVLLYPIMNYYIYDLGMGMVVSALIATIIIFIGLSMYAKNNDTYNFLNYGAISGYILIGLIISSIINIALKSPLLSIVGSALGILLFSFYIIYDINRIKFDIENSCINDKNDLSRHVFNLYLDFIHILLDLLELMSDSKK